MPILSVVMSTYNRDEIVKETIESVLNQTFSDFEFIIIDDCSNDNTFDVIKSYQDSRIKLYKNSKNSGCTFNYHVAHNIAQGKFIAHIDDDDICYLNRFETQLNYLKNHEDISVLGSFVETFGENVRPSWVFYTEPELIDFSMNLYNPICHSSIIYNKNFVESNFINYELKNKCAQDYDFYKQIILKGGKIANIPEILVKYRMHPKRLTDVFETQQIQINVAENVKDELLSRFVDENSRHELKNLFFDFPYNNYNMENVLKGVEILRNSVKNKKYYKPETIDIIENDIKNNKFRF